MVMMEREIMHVVRKLKIFAFYTEWITFYMDQFCMGQVSKLAEKKSRA